MGLRCPTPQLLMPTLRTPYCTQRKHFVLQPRQFTVERTADKLRSRVNLPRHAPSTAAAPLKPAAASFIDGMDSSRDFLGVTAPKSPCVRGIPEKEESA